MRNVLFGGTLLLSLASPALPNDSVETLRGALGQVPASWLETPAPVLAVFVDARVLEERMTAIETGAHEPALFQRYTPAAQAAPVSALSYAGSMEGWEEGTGIAMSAVDYFLHMGSPPEYVTRWQLDADPQEVIETLGAQGFAPVENAPQGVYANGEPGVPDIAAGNPFSPWRGQTGQTSVLTVTGDALIQTHRADVAQTYLADEPAMAEMPPIETALAGIAGSVQADDRIAQAMIVSPLAAMPPGDPAAVLLEGGTGAAEGAMPPFGGGIMIDLETGNGRQTVISLAYDNCETAEIASENFAAAWGETELAEAEWPVQNSFVEAPGAQGCAATVLIDDTEGDSSAYNDIFYMMSTPGGFAPLLADPGAAV